MSASALTVSIRSQQDCVGLHLRGSLLTASDTQQLTDALSTLQAPAGKHLWFDCRHLETINYQGQQALLWADRQVRVLGATAYWCGFSTSLLQQLSESGLALLLHLLPATAYRGPAEQLKETVRHTPQP